MVHFLTCREKRRTRPLASSSSSSNLSVKKKWVTLPMEASPEDSSGHTATSSTSSQCDMEEVDVVSATLSNDNNNNNSNKPPRTKKKRVSWDTLQVYELQVGLGDNPSVSNGPPLCIVSNTALHVVTLPIDDYERLRTGKRRIRQELILPASVREEHLMDLGYARSELKDAQVQVVHAKRHRQRSATLTLVERFQTILRRNSKSKVPTGR